MAQIVSNRNSFSLQLHRQRLPALLYWLLLIRAAKYLPSFFLSSSVHDSARSRRLPFFPLPPSAAPPPAPVTRGRGLPNTGDAGRRPPRPCGHARTVARGHPTAPPPQHGPAWSPLLLPLLRLRSAPRSARGASPLPLRCPGSAQRPDLVSPHPLILLLYSIAPPVGPPSIRVPLRADDWPLLLCCSTTLCLHGCILCSKPFSLLVHVSKVFFHFLGCCIQRCCSPYA